MSLYQLHRCVFDFLRAGEVSSGAAPNFDVGSYDLTDEERKAFDSKDVAALYRMGFHPVLLNGYCRAIDTRFPGATGDQNRTMAYRATLTVP
jgi:hypothetical protein